MVLKINVGILCSMLNWRFPLRSRGVVFLKTTVTQLINLKTITVIDIG